MNTNNLIVNNKLKLLNGSKINSSKIINGTADSTVNDENGNSIRRSNIQTPNTSYKNLNAINISLDGKNNKELRTSYPDPNSVINEVEFGYANADLFTIYGTPDYIVAVSGTNIYCSTNASSLKDATGVQQNSGNIDLTRYDSVIDTYNKSIMYYVSLVNAIVAITINNGTPKYNNSSLKCNYGSGCVFKYHKDADMTTLSNFSNYKCYVIETEDESTLLEKLYGISGSTKMYYEYIDWLHLENPVVDITSEFGAGYYIGLYDNIFNSDTSYNLIPIDYEVKHIELFNNYIVCISNNELYYFYINNAYGYNDIHDSDIEVFSFDDYNLVFDNVYCVNKYIFIMSCKNTITQKYHIVYSIDGYNWNVSDFYFDNRIHSITFILSCGSPMDPGQIVISLENSDSLYIINKYDI